MIVKIHPQKHKPIDLSEISKLEKSYQNGDVVALLQIIRLGREGVCDLPEWAYKPIENVFFDILTKDTLGKVGKGNGPFGDFRKHLKKTVRASAYSYIRAWQSDPTCYSNMPRHTIQLWFDGVINWPFPGYLEALRLANNALKGTKYQAHSTTIRKASIGMQVEATESRKTIEFELGLRGPNGIFGPPSGCLPKHVAELLSQDQAPSNQ